VIVAQHVRGDQIHCIRSQLREVLIDPREIRVRLFIYPIQRRQVDPFG
jgi:hypothetical protein